MAFQDRLRVRSSEQGRRGERAVPAARAETRDHRRPGEEFRLRRLRQGVRGPQVAVAAPEVRVRERQAEARVRGVPVSDPAQVVHRESQTAASQQRRELMNGLPELFSGWYSRLRVESASLAFQPGSFSRKLVGFFFFFFSVDRVPRIFARGIFVFCYYEILYYVLRLLSPAMIPRDFIYLQRLHGCRE